MNGYRQAWRGRGSQDAASGLVAFVLLCLLCVALSAVSALYPSADGLTVLTDHDTTVDASHADQGYIMVRHAPYDKRLKLRIVKDTQTYTYDLDSTGAFETFPLGFGSGQYQLQVFRQASGSRYAPAGSLSFNVQLTDDTLPYLYPNQYVWYTPQSTAVARGAELCEGLSTDAQRLQAVHDFVVSSISYDVELAQTVASGYLPSVDAVLASGKGICFDYAALTACMLRSQGVPTQLVIGYADRIYHAWNRVLVDGEWLHVDTTADANHMNVKQYTQERVY